MTGNGPGGSGENHNPLEPSGGLSEEQIADAAARQALAVPGVLRLQPGVKHAVGRAARALFAGGGGDDHLAAASGVDVSRANTAGVTVTEDILRVITAADPSPRAIAGTAQRIVRDRLIQLTGAAVHVTVVIVDVEDADPASEV